MIWTLAAKTTGEIMDEGEPSQLYETLLLEQEQSLKTQDCHSINGYMQCI